MKTVVFFDLPGLALHFLQSDFLLLSASKYPAPQTVCSLFHFEQPANVEIFSVAITDHVEEDESSKINLPAKIKLTHTFYKYERST